MSEQNKQVKRYADLIELAITGTFLWFAIRPGDLERASVVAVRCMRHLRHRLSIWEALREIRDLPEK